MIIMSAIDENKGTDFLFLESSQRLNNPRENNNIHCRTGKTTEELEVNFLERYLVAILIQDRFLVVITTEHFTPRTAVPGIFL